VSDRKKGVGGSGPSAYNRRSNFEGLGQLRSRGVGESCAFFTRVACLLRHDVTASRAIDVQREPMHAKRREKLR
jgi:hypothetical protein